MTQILYAAKGFSQTTSDLYIVDPATPGSPTVVGPIGFSLSGMAFDPTSGTLYGVTHTNSAAHPNSLISIDAGTGAGTFIGALGHQIADIGFDSLGRLFGTTEIATGGLYSIDKATGAATHVGGTYISNGGGCSFDSSDTLYATTFSTIAPKVETINTSSGAKTLGPTITGGPTGSFNCPALAFRVETLYGVEDDFSGSPEKWWLVTLDQASGALTNLGQLPDEIDALAWSLPAVPATPQAYSARGSSAASNLYAVDLSNAAQYRIGPTGVALTGMAFDPTNGTLYGATSSLSPSHPKSIVTLNPVTGAATFVAALSGSNHGQGASDICFDPSGQMYGWPNSSVGAGNFKLWKINKATGAVTEVGPDIGFSTFGGGLDYRSSDNKIVAFPGGGNCGGGCGAGEGLVYLIDPVTGIATSGATITGGPLSDGPPVAAMKLDATDLPWAVLSDFGAPVYLVNIDATTGATTLVGSLAAQTDALALAPASAATQLAYGTPPADSCAGAVAPTVTVRIEDALGNLVLSTAPVTVAIGTNPAGGTLTGTLTRNAVAGVATFNDLSINNAGFGYTLAATSPGLTPATSAAFDVLAPPTNDLCANATPIGGISGTINGNTLCAGKELPDALDAWFSTTVEHTAFFKYTALADGYLQFTIDKPLGSTLTRLTAGVLTGACGSQTVDPDALLGHEAVHDAATPAVVGHQVSVGDVIYLEIADDATLSGHSGGKYSLSWGLFTLIDYDCPVAAGELGPNLLTNPAGLGTLSYARTDDGAHWIGYFGGAGPDYHVARLDPGTLLWTDLLVDSEATVARDQINIVSDGTRVWAAVSYRSNASPYEQGIKIFEYGGGAWPLLATIPGTTPGSDGPFFRWAASAAESGVAYLAAVDTDGAGGGATSITKVDTASALWTVTPFALSSGVWIANGGGSPMLFESVAGTDTVTMYAVDPATGALAALQSFDWASLGKVTGSSAHHNVAGLYGAHAPFPEAASGGTSVYYLGVAWAGVLNQSQVVRVPADGGGPFDYFDLDVAKTVVTATSAFSGAWVILPETDSVWVVRRDGTSQFERKCADDWLSYSASGSVAFQDAALAGDHITSAGTFGFPSLDLGVHDTTIGHGSCFCELGPPVVIAEGPSLNSRFRLS